MKKMLTAVVAAMFAAASLNVMAASNAGAQGKDDKKMEKKDEKNKDEKKKDEKKKDEKKK